jgi:hypothetical protein
MTSFLKEYRASLLSPMPYRLWVSLSVIVAIAGPFGSYEAMSLLARLSLWGGIVAVSIAVGLGIRHFVRHVLVPRDFRRAAVLTASLASAIFTPPLFLVSNVLFREVLPNFPSLLEIAVLVFFVSLGASAFRRVVAPAPTAPVPPAAVAAPPSALPRLMQRLDPQVQGDLVSISVRDHYVDVCTASGQASLLLRFSDAMAEAEGVDGAQIHRSHWVAWPAVTGVERAEGKLWLTLTNGARLPVSRNHRDKLEQRGLL